MKKKTLGPANDSAPQVKIEIRSAELESAERAGEWDTVASIDEFYGLVDNAEGGAPDYDEESQAGWLARQIHDVRKSHALSDVGIDGWPRALIARLAATHDIDLLCTHDECTARGRGPLPWGWLADAETGDVLCPIHAASAVWLDVDACDEIASEPSELGTKLESSPELERHIIDALNGDEDGSPTLADLTTALDVGGDS